jgi:glutamate racemase
MKVADSAIFHTFCSVAVEGYDAVESIAIQGMMGSNAPIGIIDSGVGGLTILKEIQLALPAESLFYIGDTANCPYGGKAPAEIFSLTTTLVETLIERGVKAVVIACNTISVNCIQLLRADFPELPFIGTAPAIKPAAALSSRKRIGILSTVSTAESSYQAGLIEQFAAGCVVTNLGTNELVPLIERAEWDTGVPEILPRLLAPFKRAEIDALVLGCSHYPIIREQIQREMGVDVTVLDSGTAIARQVQRVLERESLLATGATPSFDFIATAETPAFRQIIDRLGIQRGVPAVAMISRT